MIHQYKMREVCGAALAVMALGILLSLLSGPLFANNRLDQDIRKLVAPLVKARDKDRAENSSQSGLRLQLMGNKTQLPQKITYSISSVGHEVDATHVAEDGLAPGLYQLSLKEEDQERFQHKFLALAGIESELLVNFQKETGYSLRQVLSLPQIQFQKSKKTILRASEPDLLVLSAILKSQSSIQRLDIEVHTDAHGLESSNLSLTQARAEEIGNFLIANGVSRSRLHLQGFGSSRPLVSGNLASDRLKNRRVEYVIADLCVSPNCAAPQPLK